MSAPRLDDQLCFQLYTASRLVTRAYRPLLDELGITYAQYLVLMVLWEHRDRELRAPSVKALGGRLHLDSGTLTPLLKRMEDRGLVHRRRDADDQRSVRIDLSQAGSRLSARASEVPAQLLCEVSDADQEDLVALREAVRGLVERIG